MKRVAIVTGGGKGLGLELTSALTESRHVVAVSRRSPDGDLWRVLSQAGNVSHVAGDVSDAATVSAAFKAAEGMGQIDLVINCAGAGVFGPAGSYTSADVHDVLRGNLIGTVLFSEEAYKRFAEVGGTIINVMSTAALVGRTNEAIYCASKWGARGYTESLRLEAKNTPVRVLSVFPGGMNTGFWREAKGANVDPARFMTAKEVADRIISLLGPSDTSYVSEITITRS
jgi:NAD(P)-dependent dehydrogenase (short-subunit alcohol dehydrogenase family)